MIKGKPPRLDRIYIEQPVYFVTFCTLHRKRILANEVTHQLFRKYCERGIDRGVSVGRYVIMPDHIHLFVAGSVEFELGIWVRGLKRAVDSRPNTWQPGFFDHILRSDASYSEKWNYVCNNRVRAGLVGVASDWRFAGEIVFIDRA